MQHYLINRTDVCIISLQQHFIDSKKSVIKTETKRRTNLILIKILIGYVLRVKYNRK